MPDVPALATRSERHAAGKTLRDRVARERHADLPLPAARDALAILAETDRTRLPRLVPERYRRMAASPFAFFRGGAAVMAADLAGAPTAGLAVQACGDCHVGNFGIGRSPEGGLLFEINDFDETLPGIDFTVDLKRLCASVALAVLGGEASGADDGPRADEARHAAHSAVHAYGHRMASLAELSPLDTWASRTALSDLVAHVGDPAVRATIDGFVARAGSAEDPRNYQKLAAVPAGTPPSHWRIAEKPPNIFRWAADGDGRETLQAEQAFADYRATLPPERAGLVGRYRMTDVVFKVVGVGSVGTFCALGLFTTPDGATLFLQVKEAAPSCLARLAGRDVYAGHQGERVVQGQRIMQGASDIFLGWTADPRSGRQFYVRHLKNKRLGEIAPLVRDHALAPYAKLCGAALASAHARSGDAAAITGYIGADGTFADALASFAMRYAAVTRRDHAALAARMPRTEAATATGTVQDGSPPEE